MAVCPFAIQMAITGTVGPYKGGPYKIVHHTTEGTTAAGAFATYREKRSDPHFTVDASNIWQHIDTGVAARSLRNDAPPPETNRDSAVQIEVVGFAHLPKGEPTLRNVARLCRWIEATHRIPRTWPSGHPLPAKNGVDPGGHNRDARSWDENGGHFGHCHVPENTHWDPGYTAAEVEFIMNTNFGILGSLRQFQRKMFGAAVLPESNLDSAVSTMPDHGLTSGD
ncbi:MAG: N-acetylmuramoyl-L-alanine amidase [Oricola sp.]|jgi:hypothetical protein|nr:N-acetylmuramoyl-L-alanine amidase [Oricola sp.]